MKSDCVFCKIASGQIPSHRVHEDELTVAFMDVDQGNPGHVIVAVRPHLETIVDLSSDEAAAAFRTVRRVARALDAALKPEGLAILHANAVGGAHTIAHFHLHVLPRHANDGVSLTWPRKNAPADELARVARRIRAAG
jgi:histidine triad (HIT) family protein